MTLASNRAPFPNCLQAAKDLGALIEESADDIEETRKLPDRVINALHERRLTRMLLPHSVGGDEVPPGQYLDAVIELAGHDGSVGWNVFVANSSALMAAFLDFDAARTIYGNPQGLMAWGPPTPQRAYATANGYRVSGEWGFASGCRHATWMGAHCPVEESDGSLRKNSSGRTAVRSLLFPASEAELLNDWTPIGLRGTGSESYRINDVFVTESFSSTREEPDQRRETGPLYAFTQQSLYAVGVAGVALGLANAMLDAFIRLANDKTPRGLIRHADNPTVQSEVAQGIAALGSSRAWLQETLQEIYDRANNLPCIDIPDRARVRLACTHAIQSALSTARTIYHLAGVDAIFPGSPYERRFRDINTLSQQIQSRRQHYEATGHVLMGAEPDVFF